MSTSNWSNNWIMVFIYEIDKMSTGVWVLILWLMFIYFSLKKSVVISVQSSYFYDVWKRTKRWVSYRHLSSPAVTFGFNFYNENFLLFHTCTHTHSRVRNRHIISLADTFSFNFNAKLFCSCGHTLIFTFIDSLWDHGDELTMINT